MTSADEEVRYQALLALSVGAEATLGKLFESLRDDSWRVRKLAVQRLAAELPAAEAVPRLIEALADQEDASLRNSALEALVCYGTAAVPGLQQALASSEADLRKFALDALGEIRSPDSLEGLRRAVSDADANVRLAAVEALGKIGGDAARDDLLRILGGDQIDVRLAALDALGRGLAKVPFEVIDRHLNDCHLRRAAVRALGRSQGRGAQLAILAAALDPMRGTREAAFAAVALGRQGWPDSWAETVTALPLPQRQTLAEAAKLILGAEDPGPAEGAAHLLGWLGLPEMFAPLALAADREELRPALKQALVRLGPGTLPVMTEAFAAFPAAARALALEALESVAEGQSDLSATETPGFREASQALALTCLQQDEEEVCRSAIVLLGAVGDETAAVPLLDLLSEPTLVDAGVEALQALGGRMPGQIRGLCRSRLTDPAAAKPALLRLLGRIGAAEDVPILRGVLRGGDPVDRRAAAEGLATLGVPEGTDLLRTALTDEDALVRTFAARGLSGFHSSEAIAALTVALSDPDELVAAAAAQGLGASQLPEARRALEELVGRDLVNRPVVALAALDAVARLGKVGRGVLELAVGSSDPELAKVAVRLAARDGYWEVVNGLAEHPRWDVRCEVAAVLGKNGGEASETLLRRMQERERDPLSAKAVASALAAIGGSRPP